METLAANGLIVQCKKKPLISPYFLALKFCGKAPFQHSFCTRKLGEIMIFFASPVVDNEQQSFYFPMYFIF